ncbi:MAG: FAD-dependent thymidylate synthase [Tissierellia bacterium]|nr:FAD-dependent thymidylate synthase [Tissierellia bacterium]
MKVRLLGASPEGDKLIAAAAKLCYSPVGIDEISQDLSPEATERFLKMLMDMGHASPIEHVSLSFAIEGVSRTLTHQLVRHRIASYSQQSQRYVRLDQFDYIIPPAIEKNPQAKAIFIKTMEEDQAAYDRLVDLLKEEAQKEFMAEGLPLKEAQKKAEKKAIEDARYVFPNACETKIVMTMNARSLLHFFSLRTCQRAQWEIRDLAIEMVRLCKEKYPILFAKAGPGCLVGPCPEGKMTCGKIHEVRKFFEEEV